MLLMLAGTAGAAVKLKYTETSLGLGPGRSQSDNITFSKDGRHVAFPMKHAGGWTVAIDGIETKEFEWVSPGSIVFSPDATRIAFLVQKANQIFAVNGEEISKPYAEISSPKPVISADGKRWAFAARPAGQAKGFCVVADGVEGKTYDAIEGRSVIFSPDSKHLAYAATAAGKQLYVIDGQEQRAYDQLYAMEFSADGSRYGYPARRGEKWVIVIDGQESKEYDRAGALAFGGPKGERVAYAGVSGKKSRAVIDGQEQKEYDAVDEPVFSADGQHVAYRIINFVKTKDPARGVETAKQYMWAVLDGKDKRSYDDVRGMTFSADGNHLAYIAADLQERKQMAVVDELPGKRYDRVGFVSLGPGGKPQAYSAREGTAKYAVIDGKELPGEGFITISPDGRYVAHALDEGTKSIFMVNDVRGNVYDGFLKGSKWSFTAPNRVILLAGRGVEIVRVEIEIVEE
jgi:hypothetical protein